MATKVILYSTSGCHLCEMAAGLLAQAEAQYVTQDIAFDDQLFSVYGTSIPVVKRTDSNTELGWPFELQQLTEFLS